MDQSEDAGVQTREERGREMVVCMHASRTGQVKNSHTDERRDRVTLVPWSLHVSWSKDGFSFFALAFGCWKDGLFSQKLINYRWRDNAMGWSKARTTLPSRVGTEHAGNGDYA